MCHLNVASVRRNMTIKSLFQITTQKIRNSHSKEIWQLNIWFLPMWICKRSISQHSVEANQTLVCPRTYSISRRTMTAWSLLQHQIGWNNWHKNAKLWLLVWNKVLCQDLLLITLYIYVTLHFDNILQTSDRLRFKENWVRIMYTLRGWWTTNIQAVQFLDLILYEWL